MKSEMPLWGFKRDPIQEELRRLNRESSKLGHTARRLLEETTVVNSGRHRPIQSVSQNSRIRHEPVLLVESRMARRKVILAATIAAVLAWILFRILASAPT
jgi:hypothetical protein